MGRIIISLMITSQRCSQRYKSGGLSFSSHYASIVIKSPCLSSITRTLISIDPPSFLYTYVPIPNVIKAVGTPDSPIVIMVNNVAFSPNIPKNHANKRFEDCMAFLASCPLRYALVYVPDSFLPQHICEFYL